jgi:hypothetical protein
VRMRRALLISAMIFLGGVLHGKVQRDRPYELKRAI